MACTGYWPPTPQTPAQACDGVAYSYRPMGLLKLGELRFSSRRERKHFHRLLRRWRDSHRRWQNFGEVMCRRDYSPLEVSP